VEDGKPPVEAEFRKIEQDGITLWVPAYIQFRNNEVVVVQRGFLWSAYLMLSGVIVENEDSCFGEGCH
jgi:hypothetical protein